MSSIPDDPRFQSEPASRQTSAPTDLEALSDVRLPSWSPWPTAQQWIQLAGFPCILGAVFLGMLIFNLDSEQLLWTHPLGRKMLVQLGVLSFIGVALQFGTCLLLNLLSPRDKSKRTAAGIALAVLGYGAAIVLFYAPALFVVLVGPAAIQIVETVGR